LSTFESETHFHASADETLQVIFDAMAELEEQFDIEVNMSQGVLRIDTEDGSWVLNKQAPNQQIWWSSPIRSELVIYLSSLDIS
jgi:frataxin